MYNVLWRSRRKYDKNKYVKCSDSFLFSLNKTNGLTKKWSVNLKKYGYCKKSLQVKPYNADCAFANPSSPKFNKEFTDDAFLNSMNFIKTLLK